MVTQSLWISNQYSGFHYCWYICLTSGYIQQSKTGWKKPGTVYAIAISTFPNKQEDLVYMYI